MTSEQEPSTKMEMHTEDMRSVPQPPRTPQRGATPRSTQMASPRSGDRIQSVLKNSVPNSDLLFSSGRPLAAIAMSAKNDEVVNGKSDEENAAADAAVTDALAKSALRLHAVSPRKPVENGLLPDTAATSGSVSLPNVNTPRKGTGARMLSSSNSPSVGYTSRAMTSHNGRRTELLEKYQLRAKYEPWGQTVRDDVEKFMTETMKRHAQEVARKREFREGLARQVVERKKSKEMDMSKKDREKRDANELFASYRVQTEREKAVRRERHIQEIRERELMTGMNSARNKQQLEEEWQDELERRKLVEMAANEEREIEQRRREKSEKLKNEMWEENIHLKKKLEEEKQAQYNEELRLQKEENEIREKERQRQAELVRKHELVAQARSVPFTIEDVSEMRKRNLMEKVDREQKQYLETEEKKHEERLRNKKRKQREMASSLEAQIAQKKADREKAMTARKVARKTADDDARNFWDKNRAAREQQRSKELQYGTMLKEQILTQHEIEMTAIISPSRR